ncbi:ABC-type transport auxiliary lipoprotein family protein [Terricaulis sp.]|uniref:ABC-type transport auxiliary lipoprotein family protein n=1 Tax=Terricaulis sp. TaxID=2768686 RepID=UPI0037843F10
MMRAAPLAIAAAALLGGCVSLLPKPPPPPTLFVMEAGAVERAQGDPIDAVITVAAPGGERAILGADLIWRQGDTLAYVDRAQWSARAQDGLQAMVVETLERQGRFRAAAKAGDAAGEYEIRWDVLDFEVLEDRMVARFVADVRLMAPGRRIIASEMVTAEAPVSSRSATVASQALARAAREGSARIGLFAADAAAQARAQAAATSQ